MANLSDSFILIHLQSLAHCDENLEEDFIEERIPFGNIGFIKEKFWKRSPNYRTPRKYRRSHPGLSISSQTALLAFGSSNVDNYDHNDKNYFFVNPEDCQISKRRMRFDFSTTIQGTYEMIDKTDKDYEPICEKKMQELRDAGYR